jgi:broad specificity phosphatase PhoE
MRRLLLVPHAATAATRAGAFARGDEPLEARGRAAAAALAEALPARCELLAGPALACRETVEAAGLAWVMEPALADCDWGSWAGRTLGDVGATDPQGIAAWRTDPAARPHGGESLAALVARAGRWLDEQAARDGAAAAITHAAVARAALVHVLGAPAEALWRIDAAPLSISELHAREGRWTVTRVNAPATGARGAAGLREHEPGVSAAGAADSGERDAGGSGERDAGGSGERDAGADRRGRQPTARREALA